MKNKKKSKTLVLIQKILRMNNNNDEMNGDDE